ncbi:anti-sigma factor family protein [Oricola nitratireducens]|uniref:anti-sigma factor family protein n=1 Tax=Oricola nitratireducens TaxID=2775868 RepID=UPI0018660154|nr:anti-sigma factor [Oricola nitratireducens]
MTDRPTSDIGEDDLHAYVDSALDPQRRAAVEAWLAGNPQAAADVATWQAQNEAIRSAFGREPALASTADRALIAGASARRPRRFAWAMAAGFALFFLAGGGTGALMTATFTDRGGEQVALMLPEASKTNYLVYASEVRHPVEVGADQEQHLVNWLGARIGRKLSAPDLTAKGFLLVGGRLVPFAEKPGAMLMYEDAGGDRVTVLIGTNPAHEGTDFRFEESEGVSTFYWTDGGFGYALSGAVDRETLLGLAHLCYAQYET